jgi:quercetin dioxygenase-like cupin family protein
MAEFVSGNIFIREMRFELAGDVVQGHKHNFDHTTYVARGALKVEKLDEQGSVLKSVVKRAGDGYNWVLIQKDDIHRITALEDGSIGHCIYAHRNPQGEIVAEYDGWQPAYM